MCVGGTSCGDIAMEVYARADEAKEPEIIGAADLLEMSFRSADNLFSSAGDVSTSMNPTAQTSGITVSKDSSSRLIDWHASAGCAFLFARSRVLRTMRPPQLMR